MISMIVNPSITYPSGDEFYSPDEAYPEYSYSHISSKPNRVYQSVRELLKQSGLDIEHLNTPQWNPLGKMIPEGSKVFILCNFVQNRGKTESQKGFWAKCTHGSVLRAVLDYVFLAVGPQGKVIFGNAPLQSACWEKVLEETGANRVLEFFQKQNVTVQAKDLRMFVATRNMFGKVGYVEQHDGIENAVEVDLGSDSFLTPLNEYATSFRVADYDYRRTQAYHSHGRHVYAINREILDTDVILSLPKLKTHEKVGITCALKGLVGAIAYKDCLAHHRFGPPTQHGDEYPYHSTIFILLSKLHDWVNLQDWSKRGVYIRVIDYLIRVFLSRIGLIGAGAWYGNDTAWRMALDIVRVLLYANVNGEMQQNKNRRRHLVLTDGIIGGECNGPLRPHPVQSGMLIFSDNLVENDWACSRVMGFDALKIPLIQGALQPSESYPIAIPDNFTDSAYFNGQRIKLLEIPFTSKRPYVPPRGWRRHIENEEVVHLCKRSSAGFRGT
jgi:uncharacterized protein (DUF362 family)